MTGVPCAGYDAGKYIERKCHDAFYCCRDFCPVLYGKAIANFMIQKIAEKKNKLRYGALHIIMRAPLFFPIPDRTICPAR